MSPFLLALSFLFLSNVILLYIYMYIFFTNTQYVPCDGYGHANCQQNCPPRFHFCPNWDPSRYNILPNRSNLRLTTGVLFIIFLSSSGMGATYFLPRLVGNQVASRLLLTGDLIEGNPHYNYIRYSPLCTSTFTVSFCLYTCILLISI